MREVRDVACPKCGTTDQYDWDPVSFDECPDCDPSGKTVKPTPRSAMGITVSIDEAAIRADERANVLAELEKAIGCTCGSVDYDEATGSEIHDEECALASIALMKARGKGEGT